MGETRLTEMDMGINTACDDMFSCQVNALGISMIFRQGLEWNLPSFEFRTALLIFPIYLVNVFTVDKNSSDIFSVGCYKCSVI
jgi:hypothetical protein